MSIRRSYSSSNIIADVTTIKYRPPHRSYRGGGGGLRRSTSSPDLANNRYTPRFGRTSTRLYDVWSDYWWERRYYGGERFWPHYGFPYKRFWHQKPRTSTLANYPSLSWTSRFSQYDKLDPISWRRYRGPTMPMTRWRPYTDTRFELRLSVFDSSLKQSMTACNFYVKPYQPRIWFPMPSCWPYSYHYMR